MSIARIVRPIHFEDFSGTEFGAALAPLGRRRSMAMAEVSTTIIRAGRHRRAGDPGSVAVFGAAFALAAPEARAASRSVLWGLLPGTALTGTRRTTA